MAVEAQQKIAKAQEVEPKLNRLVVAQLKKTRMCSMISRGACNDAGCRFAHSRTELRSPPDLSKTAMCYAFSRGSCVDTACKFAHSTKELRCTKQVYRTQLCNFFERGFCKKGDRCRHAHGKQELRPFLDVQAVLKHESEVSNFATEAPTDIPLPRFKLRSDAITSGAGQRVDDDREERLVRTPEKRHGAQGTPTTPPKQSPVVKRTARGVSPANTHGRSSPDGDSGIPGLNLQEPVKIAVPSMAGFAPPAVSSHSVPPLQPTAPPLPYAEGQHADTYADWRLQLQPPAPLAPPQCQLPPKEAQAPQPLELAPVLRAMQQARREPYMPQEVDHMLRIFQAELARVHQQREGLLEMLRTQRGDLPTMAAARLGVTSPSLPPGLEQVTARTS